MERRALQLDDPDGAVVARLVDDDARQPRLADAGLAADADHLAVAGDDLLPPVAQQVAFGLAAHERRQRGDARGLEPALDVALADHAPRANRLRDALQRLLAQVLEVELAARQPLRRGRDDHGIGRRQALQARREVGRIADDVLLGRPAGADGVADNDQPGSDADAHAQLESLHRLQRRDGVHYFQSGVDRALGRIFIGARVAEVGEDSVAHVARDEAVELGNDLRGRLLVQADHLARVFGVEPRGQRRRIRKVAEHDRQLAALRQILARPGLSGAAPATAPATSVRPQNPQNFAPVTLAEPQSGQVSGSAVPHSLQNRCPSPFSKRHCAHCMRLREIPVLACAIPSMNTAPPRRQPMRGPRYHSRCSPQTTRGSA